MLEYVSTLQGTDSHYGFSKGNTLPITAMPFGMVHWSPQTTQDGGWFFDPRARKLQGVRATHQPSPWMGDYGWFTVSAQSGAPLLSPRLRAAAYRPDQSTFKPNEFTADIIRDGTKIEVTPTERGAAFRFSFEGAETPRVILQAGKAESHVSILRDRNRIEGYSRVNSQGVPEGFACYFVAEFDQPIVRGATFEGDQIAYDSERLTGTAVGLAVEFAPVAGSVVTMRIATSFISIDQAAHNLEHELGFLSYEEVKSRATHAWEEMLGRIEVEGGDERHKRTFYSCLYRTLLFPRIFHEPTPGGEFHHYSPYDGKVHPGPLVTDNGFWDTYRTEYPLLALLAPSRLSTILAGWVNAYREGGWFPQWASPGYRSCMVGTHIDVVFADAVVKGIQGFDLAKAYEGLRKHAFEIGDADGSYGRLGIESYLKLGWVPALEQASATARSLDYAYDDFCISQVAEALGKHEDAAMFRERALNYEKSYDTTTGFMRGRNEDGSWLEPFNPTTWGNPYVEGGAWQSTWSVPHDPSGLISLMGGPEPFTAKLDEFLTCAPRFEVGTYGFEIHEMTEMACADFGQYAHSNQPVHHVLFLYASAGKPWRTQYWVRRVMEELYSPEDLPGDEDNGEMSAWYVLNALGIFPLCPGHPSYVFSTPLFDKVRLKRDGRDDLVITSSGNGPDRFYVGGISVDGTPTQALSISHSDFLSAREIAFTMSDTPVERVVADEDLPFSMSRGRYGGLALGAWR